jgi:uncharacterized damage-inducible protein DinB
MDTAELKSLLAYDEWANRQMLSDIEQLTEEQLTRDLSSSHRSILETLAHIVAVEWVWLERLKGNSPQAPPAWCSEPSVDLLKEQLGATEAERRDFVAALSDDSLSSVIDYKTLDGTAASSKLDDIFRHVVNHSTYHRGQVSTMMRQSGGKVTSTDLIFYLRK